MAGEMNLLKPSREQLEEYLRKWNDSENYNTQEEVL